MKRSAAIAVVLILSGAASLAAPETYRLVHAKGNSERHIAKGLTKAECESRKKDYVVVARALGGGSVTCLAEHYFAN